MIKGYLISLFLLMGWFVAQIILFRIFRPEKKFLIFTALLLLTLPLYFWLYQKTPADLGFLSPALSATPETLGLWSGLILHFLLYFTYAECFYYVDRPVTLRLLIEFMKAEGEFLPLEELQRRYSMDDMIRTRLNTMVLHGFLTDQEGRYQLTTKGKLFSWGFTTLRKIYGIPYYLNASHA